MTQTITQMASRILIVDDEEDIREMSIRSFERRLRSKLQRVVRKQLKLLMNFFPT
ncbi:hypothetical protein [Candidatus Brachybacter algidus]|uniref:hypothetical protein n=1 Tax=Candidatus Brachybacter algidus TaxID=2982024 RepID=UPI00257B1DCB|nr:hypothetical protein [Candidatus Brachybacter algidus]